MPVRLGTNSDTIYLTTNYLQVLVELKDTGTLFLNFREDQTDPQRGEEAYQVQIK